MRRGELFGRGFADIGNRQRVNPAMQRRGLGALQRFEDLRRVLLAERAWLFVRAEIQFGELVQLEIK